MIWKFVKASKTPYAVSIFVLKIPPQKNVFFLVDVRIRQHPESRLVNDLRSEGHFALFYAGPVIYMRPRGHTEE